MISMSVRSQSPSVVSVILTIVIIVLDCHLVVCHLLAQDFLKLIIVDLDQIIFIFFAHHLIVNCIVVIRVTVDHHLAIGLAMMVHLITIIIFLDLMLHALDALILDVHFFVTVFFAVVSHAIVIDLVHLSLGLQLHGLSEGFTLLWIQVLQLG